MTINKLRKKSTGCIRLNCLKLGLFFVLTAIFVCVYPVASLTLGEGVNMAKTADGDVQAMSGMQASEDEINVVADQANTFDVIGIEPQQSSEDGYVVKEYVDPISGKKLKQIFDSEGNMVKSEYYDPELGTTLTTEYENGQIVTNALVNEDTGESTSLNYDTAGNVASSDYYNPELGSTLTTEYDNGQVLSNSVTTIKEGVMQSVKIEYDPDGTTIYTTVDLTESENNKVTIAVSSGGNVDNPDDIIDATVETQPGAPAGVHWCPTTGQYEFDS